MVCIIIMKRKYQGGIVVENQEKVISENLSGGGVKWHREKIIEIVNQIEDVWILNQIHKFIINMTKEGD